MHQIPPPRGFVLTFHRCYNTCCNTMVGEVLHRCNTSLQEVLQQTRFNTSLQEVLKQTLRRQTTEPQTYAKFISRATRALNESNLLCLALGWQQLER